MIKSTWCKLVHNRFGYSKNSSINVDTLNLVECDKCLNIYEEKTKHRNIRYLKYNNDLCGTCAKKINSVNLSISGSNYLKNRTDEEKIKHASNAGKISQLKSPNNKGKFSTEKWNKKTKEEQLIQVKKANKALHDKLNSDDNIKRLHYLKIFQNSTIGFISKGHNELHKFLQDYEFEQHKQISYLQTDECNDDLKIIIEYNGDLYHCNPRKYKANDYNSVIKMCAYEKWEKDRKRTYYLKSLGYSVYIVWEYDWLINTEEVKMKLINLINNKKNEINKN